MNRSVCLSVCLCVCVHVPSSPLSEGAGLALVYSHFYSSLFSISINRWAWCIEFIQAVERGHYRYTGSTGSTDSLAVYENALLCCDSFWLALSFIHSFILSFILSTIYMLISELGCLSSLYLLLHRNRDRNRNRNRNEQITGQDFT